MSQEALLRKNMVDGQIHPSGVVDSRILGAFETIPRERFVSAGWQDVAYMDDGITDYGGAILLAPALHARLVQALKLKPDAVVLDIAGGQGYSAAILASLASTVISVFSENENIAAMSSLWEETGLYNVVALKGTLDVGISQYAPYDGIFINGAVAEIPARLMGQLSESARLACVLRPKEAEKGQAIIAEADGAGGFSVYPLFEASAPYIDGHEPRKSFVF